MLALRYSTPPSWCDAVLDDFDAFLIDHAACERKASATGLWFVVRYPDRTKLLDPMIAFAREELEHFHQIYRVIEERGLRLGPDTKDAYVGGLLRLARREPEQHLLDRLIISGVIEARGCERFKLLTDALPDGALKDLYQNLTQAESRHHALFLRLARLYFPDREVQDRTAEILDHEAEWVASLPFRAALH